MMRLRFVRHLEKCAVAVGVILSLIVSSATSCRADAVADRVATEAFVKQIETLRATNVTEAIAQIRKFQAEHATMDPMRLSTLDTLMAKIYFEDLKDTDKAIAVLDAGLPRSAKSDAYFPLVGYKANYLARAKRHEEMVALFKKEQPKYLAEPVNDFGWLRGALGSFFLSARNSGKMDEFVTTLRPILAEHPELAAYRITGREMASHLVGKPGQEAEALSWAKLYWVTSDFEEKTLNDATGLVQKAWVAKDTNTAKTTTFLKAIQDNKISNPLKEVPFPEFDTAKMRELLKSLPPESVHSRITLLLLLNEPGEAMLAARRLLLDNPSANGTVAAMEMARIFKATDLSLVRANAFLQYFQSSQGANPLDEFFKEHPVGDAAKTQ